MVVWQRTDGAQIYVIGVLLHVIHGFRRMCLEPGGDGAVADIVGLEVSMLDQDLADGGVGLVVLAVIPHAQGLTVGEQDTAGALDLQHEGIDRVGEIGGDRGLAVERAIVDGPARQAGEGGDGWFGVERDGVARVVISGARIFRLEIAGDEGWPGNGVDGEI